MDPIEAIENDWKRIAGVFAFNYIKPAVIVLAGGEMWNQNEIS